MRIRDYPYVPSSSEQDAKILRRGLLRSLLIMSAGAVVYALAAVLSLWR